MMRTFRFFATLTLLALGGLGLAQKDVPASHWAAEAVQALQKAGYLSGFPDGTFRGNLATTRYQLAVILYRVMRDLDARLLDLERTLAQGQSPDPTPPAAADLTGLLRELEDLKLRLQALEEGQRLLKEALAQPSPPASPDLPQVLKLLEEYSARLAPLQSAAENILAWQEQLERQGRTLEGISGLLALQNQDLLEVNEKIEALVEILKNTVSAEEYARFRKSVEEGLSRVITALEELRTQNADQEKRLRAVEAFQETRKNDVRLERLESFGVFTLGNSPLDFDRLTGLGDGTESAEAGPSRFGVQGRLVAGDRYDFKLVLSYQPAALGLYQLEVLQGEQRLAYGNDLAFTLSPYLGANPGGHGPATALVRFGQGALVGEVFSDSNNARGLRFGLRPSGWPELYLLYVDAGNPVYGAALSYRDNLFFLDAEGALGGQAYGYIQAGLRNRTDANQAEIRLNYRYLTPLNGALLGSQPDFLRYAPFLDDQNGFGAYGLARARGLGLLEGYLQAFSLSGIDRLAFGVKAGAELGPVQVGGFYQGYNQAGVPQNAGPAESYGQNLRGGYRNGFGLFVASDTAPVNAYAEYRVGPSASGFTLNAEYKGQVENWQGQGALYFSNFNLTNPALKVAAQTSYRFGLGPQSLRPFGLLALVLGGSGNESTLLWRLGAEWKGDLLGLTLAYGSLDTNQIGAPAGGTNRTFDGFYPGLFEGLAPTPAVVQALSGRLEVHRFSVEYHAAFSSGLYALRLAYNLR